MRNLILKPFHVFLRKFAPSKISRYTVSPLTIQCGFIETVTMIAVEPYNMVPVCQHTKIRVIFIEHPEARALIYQDILKEALLY